MRINVIGKSNGVGLSRDLDLVVDVLRSCGCEVTVTAIDSRESHRRRSRFMQLGVQLRIMWETLRNKPPRYLYELNVMLEHVWPQFFFAAPQSIAVPNPEWFDRHDVRFLSYIDRVWAKTDNTRHIFEAFGKPISQIGFDSEDRYDANVERERAFFHLAGKSTMKGTTRLVALWRKHPEWPKLVVVQHADEERIDKFESSNIEICGGYIDDAMLKEMQNRYSFHLCTSETEGWGHYLAEAMSVAAVVITVDAPPMNELIEPKRGVLVAFRDTKRQKLAERYLFDEDVCAAAVERVAVMSAQEIAALGAAARKWFLKNKEEFSGRIHRALAEVKV